MRSTSTLRATRSGTQPKSSSLSPADYREALLEEINVGSLDGLGAEALDAEDRLKGDPNAPKWVREWSGPFSLLCEEGRSARLTSSSPTSFFV